MQHIGSTVPTILSPQTCCRDPQAAIRMEITEIDGNEAEYDCRAQLSCRIRAHKEEGRSVSRILLAREINQFGCSCRAKSRSVCTGRRGECIFGREAEKERVSRRQKERGDAQ
ncbi:hypothetical protein SRHO_G00079540 [Serrasalmus rhombeus]